MWGCLRASRATTSHTGKGGSSVSGSTAAWVARVLDLLATGTVAPIVGATLPLEQVAEAHRLLESGEIVGKIVLDCR